jgi:hypothetical protein
MHVFNIFYHGLLQNTIIIRFLAAYAAHPMCLTIVLFFFIFFVVHFFTCAYIVWVIPPPCPPPPPSPPPSVSGRSCSALITDFVEEKT